MDQLFEQKVVILFVVLCVLTIIASKQPLTFVANELFTRIARNSFLVLALIIPVLAGMGLNFGIVIGAMAAQIAVFLTTHWGFVGLSLIHIYTTTRAHWGAKPGVSPVVSSGTSGVSLSLIHI